MAQKNLPEFFFSRLAAIDLQPFFFYITLSHLPYLLVQ